MRKLFIALTALISLQLTAQVEDPTDWTTSVQKISDTEYLLITEVSIEPGWHLYSQAKGEKDEGPIATEFNFFGTDDYELVGINKEEGSYADYEKVWEMDVYHFGNYAHFEQKIKLKNPKTTYIPAEAYFMVCDDTQCLPPSPESLIFKLDNDVNVVPDDVINAFYDAGAEPLTAQGPVASSIKKKGDKHESKDVKEDDENGMQDPTEWSTSVKKISNSEYVLITDVSIDLGWHLYSQAKAEKDEGPIATEFNFFGTDDYDLVGINEEKGSYADYEKVWEMDVYHFGKLAHFEQKITLKNPDLKYIAAEAYFMVCDDTQCLPPSPESLIFKLDKNVNVVPDDVINAFYDAGAEPITAQGPEANSIKKKADKQDNKDLEKEDEEKDKSLWIVFFLSFLGGFAALLTPCMFPMIPLTVSFFTKQSQNRAQGIRNAILYGIFIIAIYVLLGSAIVAIFGIEALNELSTSVTFNIAFFVILVVFALSFLGAFEITLPQSWANSADKQSNRGGIIGIFFMALALAIISFSCTGPIVGSILFESSSKGGIAPIIGMLGFSTAIALPFALFAIFPGWMNSLPKSGGWLNTVKVFLGFLELAFAFKFLSNADLVMQWGLLTREVFLVIWVAIFGTMALYLFGKIKLPHDGPETNISVGRLLIGIFSLCFAIYLLPGIWGAPLKIISGFPPPMKYSESPYGVGYTKSQSFTSNAESVELPEGAELGEYDIVTFHDYEEGLAFAKKIGKPALVDFTGHACVNCRRMEQLVWGEQEVLSILKGDVVMISLYVDEKKKLPKEGHYMSEVTGKMVRTTGNKWSELQIKNYQINAQPYYAMIGADGEDLIKPVGYTPDAVEFENWLKSGVNSYK